MRQEKSIHHLKSVRSVDPFGFTNDEKKLLNMSTIEILSKSIEENIYYILKSKELMHLKHLLIDVFLVPTKISGIK